MRIFKKIQSYFNRKSPAVDRLEVENDTSVFVTEEQISRE